MDRIFHARITAGQYAFLALATGATFFCLWERHAIVAALLMLLLTASIEKLIHTTYTLTGDGHLVLYYGRFLRGRTIALADITAVERVAGMRVAGRALGHSILIRHGHRCEVLQPTDGQALIEALLKRMDKARL